MKLNWIGALPIAAALAGPAAAEVPRDLLTGTIAGLAPLERAETVDLASADLGDPSGTTLGDLLGARLTVLNFWALWCAPCVHEMPTLAALAADPPAEGVAVVAVATGRNAPERIEAFWEEASLAPLADLRDPQGTLGRGVGVLGLPATLILDAEGREIARLTGPAEWNAEEVRTLIAALAKAQDQVFTPN